MIVSVCPVLDHPPQAREEMLLREKVIGRVKERHSHPDAKLGDLMVANYKWQRGRKLGKPHPLDHTPV